MSSVLGIVVFDKVDELECVKPSIQALTQWLNQRHPNVAYELSKPIAIDGRYKIEAWSVDEDK